MVSTYTINTCEYRLDNLKKVVYLLDKTCLGDVNTKDYYINGGSGALRIQCNTLTVTESSSLDERYSFSHNVTFSVDGYKTTEDLNGKYHVAVVDKNGNWWVVNPEFKMKVSYTYTLSTNSESTTFTMTVDENIPMLRAINFAPWATSDFSSGTTLYRWATITPISGDSSTYICAEDTENKDECKDYSYCGISDIRVNETVYSTYSNGFAIYTNDGFKTIDFAKDSATFTETNNGENVTHTLKFSIPLTSSSWHNHLLDFDCTYCTILTTNCGKSIACGFKYGLTPSYAITASTSQTDKIEVTLTNLQDEGELIFVNSTINSSGTSATTWVFEKQYYDCVTNGVAKYTLKQQYDVYGNPLDMYMCMNGYRVDYEWLAAEGKLVSEEFEDTSDCYFQNYDGCKNLWCELETTLKDVEFNDTSSKNFSVYCSTSDWSISSSTSSIVVTPSSGYAAIQYTVNVKNNITPTSASSVNTLLLTYCGNEEAQYEVTVKEKPINDIFPQGNTYYVDEYAQTLTIPTSVNVTSATSNVGFATPEQVQNGYITVNVQNNVSSARTATIDVSYGNNTATLYVVQSSGGTPTPPTPTALKFYATYNDNTTYSAECDSSSVLTSGETTSHSTPYSAMSTAIIGDCVTEIGTSAFEECISLSSVTIPQTVTSIDSRAFYRCSGLTNIDIPSGVTKITDYAFQTCSSLSSVTIPSGVTSIGFASFGGCSSLSSVTIPSSVTALSGGTFIECYGLQFVKCEATTPPSGVTWLTFYLTNDCPIYVPCESVAAYKSANGWSNYANRITCLATVYRTTSGSTYCENYDKYVDILSQVSYDSGLTWTTTATTPTLVEHNSEDCGYVPPTFNGKFYATYNDSTSYSAACDSSSVLTSGETRGRNSAMTTVEIGTCVEEIGRGAFSGCTSLSSVTIPNSVTTISSSSFAECFSLSSITIPNSVTSIGAYAFEDCSRLTSVIIPSGVTIISKMAFSSCYSLTSVTIPNSVTSIGEDAFSGCYSLSSITIPSSVTSIGEAAFNSCSGLTSITIPSGVTIINDYTFEYCSGLTSVIILGNVTSLGQYAFEFCSITSFTCYAITPPLIYLNTFNATSSNMTIYVPSESVEAYKSADGWSTYASRIQAITT